MNKFDLITQIEEYKSKMVGFDVYLGELTKADDVIGYYFDNADGMFKVYINYERGRHHVRKSTESENEALEKVLSMIKAEVFD